MVEYINAKKLRRNNNTKAETIYGKKYFGFSWQP